MYCNRLHAWWSPQSRLATLLSSLIARRWVGLQTIWRFQLKDLSIDEKVGAWCFGCLSVPPGFTCWISFAPVFNIFDYWLALYHGLVSRFAVKNSHSIRRLSTCATTMRVRFVCERKRYATKVKWTMLCQF